MGGIGLVGLCIGSVRNRAVFTFSNMAWVLIGGGLIAAWLGIHTTNQPVNVDSGLYHLNCVRWAKEYAIVPGLGNLHARLALNQSYFLYSALLDVGEFAHRSHQLASGLLCLWALIRSLVSIRAAIRARDRLKANVIYDITMIGPVVYEIVNGMNISSPSPDICVFLLGTTVASELIRVLDATACEEREYKEKALPVILLAVLGVTVKISFAATAATVFAVVLVYGRLHVGRRMVLPLFGMGALWSAFILAPWVGRGIILSGYVAFPLAVLPLPVDWRMPVDMAHRCYGLIRMWALTCGGKIPAEYMGSAKGYWLWLMYVLRTQKPTIIVPVSLAILGLLYRQLYRPARRVVAEWGFDEAYFLVPCVSLIYWFVTAPDQRFAGASFWMLGAGVVALVLATVSKESAVLSLIFVTGMLLSREIGIVDAMGPWRKDNGPARTVVTEERTTDSGLKVYVATVENEGRTWDSPLPSMPFFNPRVELRVPGDVSKGFRIRQK